MPLEGKGGFDAVTFIDEPLEDFFHIPISYTGIRKLTTARSIQYARRPWPRHMLGAVIIASQNVPRTWDLNNPGSRRTAEAQWR
jgi:hypothetical protein